MIEYTESHTPRGVLKKKGFHRAGVIQYTTRDRAQVIPTATYIHLSPNDRPRVTATGFLTAYHTFYISRQRVRVLLDFVDLLQAEIYFVSGKQGESILLGKF